MAWYVRSERIKYYLSKQAYSWILGKDKITFKFFNGIRCIIQEQLRAITIDREIKLKERERRESRQDNEGHVSLKCIIRFIKFLVVISCCKNPFLIYDLVYIQFKYCTKV